MYTDVRSLPDQYDAMFIVKLFGMGRDILVYTFNYDVHMYINKYRRVCQARSSPTPGPH